MSQHDPRGLLRGLPRRVRIAGLDFTLKVVGPDKRPEIDKNNGLCLPDSREVLLDAEMVRESDPSLILNTVVHELTHAVNSHFGVTDASTEEDFCTNHTNGVVAMWLDNPKLVAWITRLLRLVRESREAEPDTH